MVEDLVSFAVSLTAALVVAFPLGSALKRRPGAFYVAALALAGLYALYQYGGMFGNPALQLVAEALRKGYVATCLLATVMVCGALEVGSPARKRIQPIRAELSILSLIMYVPHIVAFLPMYASRLGALLSAGGLLGRALAVALALVAVYVVLVLLSIGRVRAAMPHRLWKGIQRLAYLMVALVVLHVWLALGPAAVRGGSPEAVVPLAVYTCAAVLYAAARIRRAVLDAGRRGRSETVGAAEAA